VAIDEAHDAGDALEPRRDTLEGCEVIVDEPGAHEEVFRRVARKGQFRECNDVGALLSSTLTPLEDLRNVAIEVTDGRVDLRESDTKLANDGASRYLVSS
jgi:hypothetical protein